MIEIQLNPQDQKILQEIQSLFETLSLQTTAFAQATGMHCKTDCGKCCENPEIETTVAEMMPLAMHLWTNGQADELLAKLTDEKNSICAMYAPDKEHRGRCTAYAHRPGICRLFGFSAKKDKYNNKQLVTCGVIKEHFPEDFSRAQKHIADGTPVPMVSNHAMNVANIDPHWGKENMPINKALRIALERVGFSLRPNRDSL